MKKALILAGIAAAIFAIALNRNANDKQDSEKLEYAAGDHTVSMMSGGLRRSYQVHVPESKNVSDLPMLLVLHGGTGDAADTVKLTQGEFNALSASEGFIVVYPNGIDKHWNDGRTGMPKGYRSHQENIDDVGSISDLIDQSVDQLKVNPNRIYVTGISNGGMMSYRLAVELGDKIAAIAPVTANMPVDLSGVPTKPMPIAIFNGTKDPLMPWDGGVIGKNLGKVISVRDTVNYWVKHNGCSGPPITSYETDSDPKDGTRTRKEIYENCKENARVILYSVENGGHTWPGGLQYLPEMIVGKTSRDINASQLIWDFLKVH